MPEVGPRAAEVAAKMPWGQVGKELVLLAASVRGVARAEEVAEAALAAVHDRGWKGAHEPLWTFLTGVLTEGIDGQSDREKAKAEATRITAMSIRAIDDELRTLGLDPAGAFAMGERHRPQALVTPAAAGSSNESIPTLSTRQWAALTLVVLAFVALAWAAVALRG